MNVREQLGAALADRYTIERELGGGGMSLVFVALEQALGRRVVLKVLSPELGQTVNVDRFKQEIATLATLQHPLIVPVFHAGQAAGLLYYVMPFVAGESLGARLAREGPLPAAEVIRLLTALSRALAFAHREGVVHRDIKPDNILLAEGEPVLADFGIAKLLRDGTTHGTLTSAGMSIGTVTYMAPEQVVADPTIDGRADVYSLAAVGYELLAGRAPFEGTPQQVMSAHVVKPPPSLTVTAPATPEALRIAIERGLAKEAADRPTAEQFAQLLEQAMGHAASVAPAAAPEAAPITSTRRLSRGLLSAIALLAAVAVGGGLWKWSPSAAPSGATPSPGVAVLPFERIGSAEDAYIADGLTEELMGQFAAVPELRVAARTTVKAYADSALPPTELGRRLDVSALVEGSVQRVGDQLRVSTRLVDVRDGSTIWSERYERQMRDLFAVQRDIGVAVVTALTPRLGLTGTAGRREAGTADAEAYDLFLRAQYALSQRGTDSLRAAIALFRRATSRDSAFARAYAGIAEASALLPQYGGGGYDDVAGEVREAAATALRLDSTLATPHMALGLLTKGRGEWAAAEQALRRAVAREPGYATAHQNLGELLYTLGRLDEAERAFTKAATLEPANVPMVSEFAFALAMNGRVDSARRVIDRALARDAGNGFTHFAQAVILDRQGDGPAAVRAMAEAVQRVPLAFFTGAQIRMARRAGDRQVEVEARARLRSVGTAPGTALARVVADADTADVATMLGALEQAVTERDPLVYQFPLRIWWLDRLRSSPDFARVASRMALPPTAILPSVPVRRP